MSTQLILDQIKKQSDKNRKDLERLHKDLLDLQKTATWFIDQYEYAVAGLVQLAMFEPPERLRKADIGLPYEEIVEMAYENMIQYANDTVLQLRGRYDSSFPHPSQE